MASLPRRVNVVRLAAALPLVALGMLIVWLVIPHDVSSALEPGEPFPDAPLEMIHGRGPGIDTGSRDVVVFFRPNCEPCRVQMGMLERSVIGLGEARLHLMSTSPAAEIRTYMREWPALAGAQSVSWASISVGDARELFRVKSTPTIIVFDDLRVASVTMGTATLSSILDHANNTSGRLGRTAHARDDRNLRNRSAGKCGSCEVEQHPNGSRP